MLSAELTRTWAAGQLHTNYNGPPPEQHCAPLSETKAHHDPLQTGLLHHLKMKAGCGSVTSMRGTRFAAALTEEAGRVYGKVLHF